MTNSQKAKPSGLYLRPCMPIAPATIRTVSFQSDPDAEARQREHEREHARHTRLLKRRADSFKRILDNVPPTFTAPQLRVLLRALVHVSPLSPRRRRSCILLD